MITEDEFDLFTYTRELNWSDSRNVKKVQRIVNKWDRKGIEYTYRRESIYLIVRTLKEEAKTKHSWYSKIMLVDNNFVYDLRKSIKIPYITIYSEDGSV